MCYRREPSAETTECFLHPLLRTLEVNSKSLALVLERAEQLQGLRTLYLFFDINRCVSTYLYFRQGYCLPLVPFCTYFLGMVC